jgi:hypothetical protein
MAPKNAYSPTTCAPTLQAGQPFAPADPTPARPASGLRRIQDEFRAMSGGLKRAVTQVGAKLGRSRPPPGRMAVLEAEVALLRVSGRGAAPHVPGKQPGAALHSTHLPRLQPGSLPAPHRVLRGAGLPGSAMGAAAIGCLRRLRHAPPPHPPCRASCRPASRPCRTCTGI